MGNKAHTVIILVILGSPIIGGLMTSAYDDFRALRKYNKRQSHPSMKYQRVY
jgi:hypothetical protein